MADDICDYRNRKNGQKSVIVSWPPRELTGKCFIPICRVMLTGIAQDGSAVPVTARGRHS